MLNLIFKSSNVIKPRTKDLSYSQVIILTFIITASSGGDPINNRYVPLNQLIERSHHLDTNKAFSDAKIYRNIQEELILFLDERKWIEIITPEFLNTTSPDHLIELPENSNNILHQSLLRSLGTINYTRK